MQPRITIGVPVFNGEAHLRECLSCLSSQTSTEFSVLIMDNASTDGTPEIAREFVERDPRFRVVRQPRTVDARQNFTDVLAAADTDYYAWRAYDDLSAADWIEKLTAVLDENPWASLAVGRVIGVNREGRQIEDRDAPVTSAQAALSDVRRLMMSISPAWMYGLYRRQEIRRVFARCRGLYPYVWSLDILVILNFVLNRALAGTNGTAFQYRATGLSQSYLRPNHYVDGWTMWRSFYRSATAIMQESNLAPAERRALRWTMPRFADQRSEKLRRILRGALGAWLLGTDGRVRKEPLKRIAVSQ